MEIILILLVVSGLLAIWLVPAYRGAPRKADTLESALVQLMQREELDVFLIIRPRYSPYKFIQYARTQQGSGRFGLELAFPEAKWSEDYFPKVVSLASKQGVAFDIQNGDGSGLRFVFVRFGTSTSQAAQFGRTVLTDIFGFDEGYRFRARIN